MDGNEKVYLSEYDSDWENQFLEEKQLLQTHFPDIPIEHIGSTSIKGMTAKPIIDIILGVTSYPPSEDMTTTLEKLGYYGFGEADRINGRLYFIKRGVKNYNVHVIKHLDKLWNNNIFFRNYLRENEAEVLAYAEVKQNIINKGINSLYEYSDEKEDFISNIINKINT